MERFYNSMTTRPCGLDASPQALELWRDDAGEACQTHTHMLLSGLGAHQASGWSVLNSQMRVRRVPLYCSSCPPRSWVAIMLPAFPPASAPSCHACHGCSLSAWHTACCSRAQAYGVSQQTCCVLSKAPAVAHQHHHKAGERLPPWRIVHRAGCEQLKTSWLASEPRSAHCPGHSSPCVLMTWESRMPLPGRPFTAGLELLVPFTGAGRLRAGRPCSIMASRLLVSIRDPARQQLGSAETLCMPGLAAKNVLLKSH